ncbi:uncharacterized protein LOC119400779 [Rhipicephalus sanguineus]|uniref:uncharacterized protein LOC119400779 n=1 Tax=Rhipicephalus sanguineus TaxID=34632 RepID=UPI001893B594|nr:uncharacterized protein LOC119400779 [Rhipicephalus sanguineus]
MELDKRVLLRLGVVPGIGYSPRGRHLLLWHRRDVRSEPARGFLARITGGYTDDASRSTSWRLLQAFFLPHSPDNMLVFGRNRGQYVLPGGNPNIHHNFLRYSSWLCHIRNVRRRERPGGAAL